MATVKNMVLDNDKVDVVVEPKVEAEGDEQVVSLPVEEIKPAKMTEEEVLRNLNFCLNKPARIMVKYLSKVIPNGDRLIVVNNRFEFKGEK